MEIFGLQSAMHINFDAKVGQHTAFSLFEMIYPAFKCNPHLKIGEIVVSKTKDKHGYSHVTIPLFI